MYLQQPPRPGHAGRGGGEGQVRVRWCGNASGSGAHNCLHPITGRAPAGALPLPIGGCNYNRCASAVPPECASPASHGMEHAQDAPAEDAGAVLTGKRRKAQQKKDRKKRQRVQEAVCRDAANVAAVAALPPCAACSSEPCTSGATMAELKCPECGRALCAPCFVREHRGQERVCTSDAQPARFERSPARGTDERKDGGQPVAVEAPPASRRVIGPAPPPYPLPGAAAAGGPTHPAETRERLHQLAEERGFVLPTSSAPIPPVRHTAVPAPAAASAPVAGSVPSRGKRSGLRCVKCSALLCRDQDFRLRSGRLWVDPHRLRRAGWQGLRAAGVQVCVCARARAQHSIAASAPHSPVCPAGAVRARPRGGADGAHHVCG